jgi:HSF-type DNA-binding
MMESKPTTQEQELVAVRRNSTASESSKQSGDASAENPLMKLVDAALSPNNQIKATAEGETAVVTQEAPPQPAVEATKEESVATITDTEKKALAPDGEKVIRGTVQDLVARQEKMTFAEYLMACLTDESNHDVLQWMPCGTQFTITNHRKFTMERMPTLFKIRNMSSFVRKLTRWGFSRVHEKETGNSDIFKHDLFLRDTPELCKKIRCVNRAAAAAAAAVKPLPNMPSHSHHGHSLPFMPPMSGGGGGSAPGLHTHPDLMMHHHSEASMMHRRISGEEMALVSPRRSMGFLPHGRSSMSSGSSPYSSRFHTSPASSSYMHGSSPRHGHSNHRPRVSPEYERDMLGPNGFHHHGSNNSGTPNRPGPPQVYSPPSIGRTMSAAAEYELEQILLERQRARRYREQQLGVAGSQAPQLHHHHQRHGSGSDPRSGGGPSMPSRSSMSHSERSSMSNSLEPLDPSSEMRMSLGGVNFLDTFLDTLEQDGDYDLDMSPREAMLRAVLHKRQQQRAQKQRASSMSGGGGGILKRQSSYFDHAAAAAAPSDGAGAAATQAPSTPGEQQATSYYR